MRSCNRCIALLTRIYFQRLLSCFLLLLAIHQSHTRFETDFNCNEIKQSDEYINDLKNFVMDMAEHFNKKPTQSLDLSTTGVGFIEDSNYLTRTYQNVLSLNLSMNVLKRIDSTFLMKFPGVQTLDLSRNCLTFLDMRHRLLFLDLQSLSQIDFSHNLIKSVHPFAFSNVSLDSVDLSHNRLIRFWMADYEINQLHLNDNKISHVEISSTHYKEMKQIDARNNKIRIFQASVDFENLILSNNQLKLDEYFSIRNIFGTLDISRNLITEFDWKIINCATNLNLAFNRFSALPLECPSYRFKRLQRLNLNGNFLCNFDQSVNLTACFPKLKFISLLGNQLSSRSKIKTKKVLTSLGVKSQIFDYEYFSELDDDNEDFNIFKQ